METSEADTEVINTLVFKKLGKDFWLSDRQESKIIPENVAGTRFLCASRKFGVIFCTDACGVYFAKTERLLELSQRFKDQGIDNPVAKDAQGVARIPLVGVQILALSDDDLILAVCTDVSISFYDVQNLVKKADVELAMLCKKTLDDARVMDFLWCPKEPLQFAILSSTGELLIGRVADELGDTTFPQVAGASWSPDGCHLATASQEGAVTFYSSNDKSVSHSLELPRELPDLDFPLRVVSMKWVRDDTLLLEFENDEDGPSTDRPLAALLSPKGPVHQVGASVELVALRGLFPGVWEEAIGGSMFVEYLHPWNMCIAACPKSIDDHINVLTWQESDEGTSLKVVEFEDDKWVPRIELQAGGDDNTILGMALDLTSTQLKLIDPRDESSQKLLSPPPVLIVMTSEGKLCIFACARLDDIGQTPGLVNSPQPFPQSRPLLSFKSASPTSAAQEVSTNSSVQTGGKVANARKAKDGRELEHASSNKATGVIRTEASLSRVPPTWVAPDSPGVERSPVSEASSLLSLRPASSPPIFPPPAPDPTACIAGPSDGSPRDLFEIWTKSRLLGPSTPPALPPSPSPSSSPGEASSGSASIAHDRPLPSFSSGAPNPAPSTVSFNTFSAYSNAATLSPPVPQLPSTRPSFGRSTTFGSKLQSLSVRPTAPSVPGSSAPESAVAFSPLQRLSRFAPPSGGPFQEVQRQQQAAAPSPFGTDSKDSEGRDEISSPSKRTHRRGTQEPPPLEEQLYSIAGTGSMSSSMAHGLAPWSSPESRSVLQAPPGTSFPTPLPPPSWEGMTQLPSPAVQLEPAQPSQAPASRPTFKAPSTLDLPPVFPSVIDRTKRLPVQYGPPKELQPPLPADRIGSETDFQHSLAKVQLMGNELDALLASIEGKKNPPMRFGEAGPQCFTQAEVEAVEKALGELSLSAQRLKSEAATLRGGLEELRVDHLQVDARRAHLKSLTEQAADPLYQNLLEQRRLDPLMELRRVRLLKANEALKRQIGNLQSHVQEAELARRHQDASLSSGRSSIGRWQPTLSRHTISTQSLYNAMNDQLSTAQQLARQLSAALELLQPVSVESDEATSSGAMRSLRPAAASILKSLGMRTSQVPGEHVSLLGMPLGGKAPVTPPSRFSVAPSHWSTHKGKQGGSEVGSRGSTRRTPDSVRAAMQGNGPVQIALHRPPPLPSGASSPLTSPQPTASLQAASAPAASSPLPHFGTPTTALFTSSSVGTGDTHAQHRIHRAARKTSKDLLKEVSPSPSSPPPILPNAVQSTPLGRYQVSARAPVDRQQQTESNSYEGHNEQLGGAHSLRQPVTPEGPTPASPVSFPSPSPFGQLKWGTPDAKAAGSNPFAAFSKTASFRMPAFCAPTLANSETSPAKVTPSTKPSDDQSEASSNALGPTSSIESGRSEAAAAAGAAAAARAQRQLSSSPTAAPEAPQTISSKHTAAAGGALGPSGGGSKSAFPQEVKRELEKNGNTLAASSDSGGSLPSQAVREDGSDGSRPGPVQRATASEGRAHPLVMPAKLETATSSSAAPYPPMPQMTRVIAAGPSISPSEAEAVTKAPGLADTKPIVHAAMSISAAQAATLVKQEPPSLPGTFPSIPSTSPLAVKEEGALPTAASSLVSCAEEKGLAQGKGSITEAMGSQAPEDRPTKLEAGALGDSGLLKVKQEPGSFPSVTKPAANAPAPSALQLQCQQKPPGGQEGLLGSSTESLRQPASSQPAVTSFFGASSGSLGFSSVTPPSGASPIDAFGGGPSLFGPVQSPFGALPAGPGNSMFSSISPGTTAGTTAPEHSGSEPQAAHSASSSSPFTASSAGTSPFASPGGGFSTLFGAQAAGGFGAFGGAQSFAAATASSSPFGTPREPAVPKQLVLPPGLNNEDEIEMDEGPSSGSGGTQGSPMGDWGGLGLGTATPPAGSITSSQPPSFGRSLFEANSGAQSQAPLSWGGQVQGQLFKPASFAVPSSQTGGSMAGGALEISKDGLGKASPGYAGGIFGSSTFGQAAVPGATFGQSGGTFGQAPSAFGLPNAVGGSMGQAHQTLGSALGAFGQTRSPQMGISSQAGFGFASAASSGGFAAAATGGGFAAAAAAAATGGNAFSSFGSGTPVSGFGAFGGNQQTGGPAIGSQPQNIFTAMRK